MAEWTASDWSGLLREIGQTLVALASLIAALKASRASKRAEDAARDAGQKAAEAAREQLTFALKREVLALKGRGEG